MQPSNLRRSSPTIETRRASACSLAFALGVAVAAWPVVARADVIPPDVLACGGGGVPSSIDATKIGKACQSDALVGTCEKGMCARADYANWDRDASPQSPPSVTYECLRCIARSAPSGGTGESSAGDRGCSCAVVGRTAVRAATPWLLALVVPALVHATRRRKRTNDAG
jgi:hypothetical protein